MRDQITTVTQVQTHMVHKSSESHKEQMRRFDELDRDIQANHQATAAVPAELERCHDHFEIVEGHIIEVKALIRMQEEVPQRVLYGTMIRLIDPFEANWLPVPLDTIDSFEALLALFGVRFKHKGKAALNMLRGNNSDMYDHRSQS